MHVLALVVGNFVMVLMYFYENLVVFLWALKTNWYKRG